MIPQKKKEIEKILCTEHVLVAKHHGQQKQLRFGVKKF
jgi:hypothetical protein